LFSILPFNLAFILSSNFDGDTFYFFRLNEACDTIYELSDAYEIFFNEVYDTVSEDLLDLFFGVLTPFLTS